MGVKGVVLATLVLPAALLVLLGPATLSAQTYVIEGWERFFRIDFTTMAGRHGPVVSGYVYNTYGHTADRVRLIVESVDASGAVTGTTLVFVPGTIGPDDRRYFEAAVPPGGVSYRVRVASFDPIGRGP
jgi:hypothetical protein